MKSTKILSCISIVILGTIVLDAYVVQGKKYKKIYDRRYSEGSKSRSERQNRKEFIMTNDGSTYSITTGTFIPLQSGDQFTVEKTKLLNRSKSISIGENDQEYTIYLSLMHIDHFAKIIFGISLLSALAGLIGRLLRVRSDIRFTASFFSAVMAVGLLIFYLW